MKAFTLLLAFLFTTVSSQVIYVHIPYDSGTISLDNYSADLYFSSGAAISLSKYDFTYNSSSNESGEFVFSFTDTLSTVKYESGEVDTTLFFRYDHDGLVDTLDIYPSHPAFYFDAAKDSVKMSEGFETPFFITVEGKHTLRCSIVKDETSKFGILKWETDSLGNGIYERVFDTTDVSEPYSNGKIDFDFSTLRMPFSNGAVIDFSKYDQTAYTNGGAGLFVLSFIDSLSSVTYKSNPVDTTQFFKYSADGIDLLGRFPTHPVARYNPFGNSVYKLYEMTNGYHEVFYISVDGKNSLKCRVVDNLCYPNFATLMWETDSLGNGVFKSEPKLDTITVAQIEKLRCEERVTLLSGNLMLGDTISSITTVYKPKKGKFTNSINVYGYQLEYFADSVGTDELCYIVTTVNQKCYKVVVSFEIDDKYINTFRDTLTLGANERVCITDEEKVLEFVKMTGVETVGEITAVEIRQQPSVGIAFSEDFAIYYTAKQFYDFDTLVYTFTVDNSETYCVNVHINIDHSTPITQMKKSLGKNIVKEVRIYSISGRLVKSLKNVDLNNYSLSSDLPKAIYFMQIPEMKTTRKILVH